jgi:hypothetical protein
MCFHLDYLGRLGVDPLQAAFDPVEPLRRGGDVGVNDRKPRIHAHIHGRQTTFDASRSNAS